MGLVGVTFMAWMVVRVAWVILSWVIILLWLVLRGAWFLLITLPKRAIRKHRANREYQRLIARLVDEPRVAGDRRIDRPTS